MDKNFFNELSVSDLSDVCGGGLGGHIVTGALAGAFQAGQQCILAGPQAYLICAAGGAVVGGVVAYGLRPPKL
ncbi:MULTISPECIES: Blp family class II bacteriocin [Streptococcus]|uniref:Blp family class II bacteriocin n=1 Tax=Streptococcus TaxID=1301 RepID=UPI001F5667F2|nr:Blp family class II bacteriocin [Streptococcus thoraltensis]